jgi:hypothetical protein
MHSFANPARFLRIAKPLTPALFWPGLFKPHKQNQFHKLNNCYYYIFIVFCLRIAML